MTADANITWIPMPDMFEIRCPLPGNLAGDYDIADSGQDEAEMRESLFELRARYPEKPYTFHRIRGEETQIHI
ncbi:hypothetical protein [Paucibacter soli]|uniref:hypothetical protein n=1 Tax=Paucibacter soli TaxID=3133433 RepID=UPI0030A876D5